MHWPKQEGRTYAVIVLNAGFDLQTMTEEELEKMGFMFKAESCKHIFEIEPDGGTVKCELCHKVYGLK